MPLNLVSSQVTTSAFDPLRRWREIRSTTLGEESCFEEAEVAIDKTAEAVPVPTSDLNKFIGFEFSVVPEVEYVYTVLRDNRVFYVWIVISAWEKKVRERVYAREQAIMDEFPSFSFDFYVVDQCGEDVADLISQSLEVAYRRR